MFYALFVVDREEAQYIQGVGLSLTDVTQLHRDRDRFDMLSNNGLDGDASRR